MDKVFESKNNDMGLFLRVKYNGADAIPYHKVLESEEYHKILENTSDPTEEEEFYLIRFTELFNLAKKCVLTCDIKENQVVSKKIIYFQNHDKTVEGYFIYHDTDFVDKKYYEWFEKTLQEKMMVKVKNNARGN